MSVKKHIGRAFSWIMKALVYLVLGIPIVLNYCYLRYILARQIRRLEDERMEQADEDSSQADRTAVNIAPDSEILDFKLHRSNTYIHQRTFGKLAEIAKFASGKQRVPLVSEFIIRHVLFHSMFSYGLKEETDNNSEIEWRFSFKEFGRYVMLRKVKWDVAEILVLKSERLIIVDSSGKIHTPFCKTWPLAKAHAQVQLTQLAPGMIHNIDHLVLPSVFARAIRKVLAPTSNLRRLLEEHIRFSEVVNNIEMRDIKFDIESTESNSFMRPKMEVPVDHEYAKAELQRNCEAFYSKDNSVIPDLNSDVDYHSFIKGYYGIFRDFVTDLSPHLEPDYELLRKEIEPRFPGLARQNMVDVLSAFLWNSSIAHTADHVTYLKQWGWKYGCMAIKTPLVKPRKNGANENIRSSGNGVHLPISSRDDVTTNGVTINIEHRRYANEDGVNFFRSIDVFRTSCFLRTYIQYHPSQSVDMALCNTDYGFTDPEVAEIANNFLMNIKDMSSMLKQRGEAVVRGHEFIRSICF